MGMLAGYTSSRLYKMFKSGSEWKHITMATAIQFPGFAFVIFAILNTLLQDENSSATVPPTTMCALVLLWSGIAPPLVFLGGYLGYKRPAIEPPVEINKTPRKIPKQDRVGWRPEHISMNKLPPGFHLSLILGFKLAVSKDISMQTSKHSHGHCNRKTNQGNRRVNNGKPASLIICH